MSDAEGFLCSTLPASLKWPARPGSARLARPDLSETMSRSQAIFRLTRTAATPPSHQYLGSLASCQPPSYPGPAVSHLTTPSPVAALRHPRGWRPPPSRHPRL